MAAQKGTQPDEHCGSDGVPLGQDERDEIEQGILQHDEPVIPGPELS